MYLVSACLLGIECRYDGNGMQDEALMKLAAKGHVVPVCPEQLGGCPTPREPCEIEGGDGAGVLDGKCRVVCRNGLDMTVKFIKGAQETLKLAKMFNVDTAVLKARSPSCGFGKVYDGTFSGKLTRGNGVAAELLHRNGIKVYTEESNETEESIKKPEEAETKRRN